MRRAASFDKDAIEGEKAIAGESTYPSDSSLKRVADSCDRYGAMKMPYA